MAHSFASKVYDESLALIRQVAYGYGKEGEVLSVSGNTPEPVTYVYDAMYRVKTLTDGNGNATTWSYGTKGYLSSVAYPGGDTVTYTAYNNAAQLTTMTDPRGVVSDFTYTDPDGELTTIAYPAYPGQNVAYSYDSYGRVSSKADEAGVETYAYGDSDEPTQKTVTYVGLTGKTVGRTYFPNGSLKTLATPAGTFGYLYDNAGRLASLTNPFNETTGYTYLNNDWLSGQTLANGVGSGFTYDALGQLITLTNALGAGTLSSFGGMTYDGAGNRLGVTASVPALPALSGSTTYAYDTKSQVTQEASTRAGGFTNNYAYDAAGNPTTFKGQTRTYNAKNQITGGVGLAGSFTYDSDGNPTTYNGATATFNVNDNLTSLGSAITAGYDSDGFRVWKQNTTTWMRTYFLYEEGYPICELDSTGNILATNTWGSEGLVSRRSGSASVFYVFDERGNTVQRLTSTGAVLSTRISDAFGTPGGTTSTSDPYDGFGGRYGYYTDVETGLQLCTFRYYHALTGRWLNRDPIGYEGGINLYGYCSNDPIGGVDPSGLLDDKEVEDCKNHGKQHGYDAEKVPGKKGSHTWKLKKDGYKSIPLAPTHGSQPDLANLIKKEIRTNPPLPTTGKPKQPTAKTRKKGTQANSGYQDDYITQDVGSDLAFAGGAMLLLRGLGGVAARAVLRRLRPPKKTVPTPKPRRPIPKDTEI